MKAFSFVGNSNSVETDHKKHSPVQPLSISRSGEVNDETYNGPVIAINSVCRYKTFTVSISGTNS